MLVALSSLRDPCSPPAVRRLPITKPTTKTVYMMPARKLHSINSYVVLAPTRNLGHPSTVLLPSTVNFSSLNCFKQSIGSVDFSVFLKCF